MGKAKEQHVSAEGKAGIVPAVGKWPDGTSQQVSLQGVFVCRRLVTMSLELRWTSSPLRRSLNCVAEQTSYLTNRRLAGIIVMEGQGLSPNSHG